MNQNKTKINKQKAQPSFVSQKPQAKANVSEKNTFVLKEVISDCLSWGWIALFTAFAAFILITRNSDLLYQAQNFSFFNSTEEYFNECMKLPAGLIAWIASYFTQYFYEPTVGASIIMAFWAVIFYVTKKALKVSSVWAGLITIPVFALLASEVGTGYWIYYLKQNGYWFFGTVGFLISMLLTWAAQISKNSIYRCVLVAVISLTYPLFGWYSLIAIAYIAIIHIIDNLKSNSSIINKLSVAVLGIVLIGAVPFFCYSIYSNMRLEDVWMAGFPHFRADALDSFRPQIPFYILSFVPFVLILLPKQKTVAGWAAFCAIITNIAVIGLGTKYVLDSDVQDYNYHAEMRMYRNIENQEWDKVLDEMSNLPGDANRQMVLFKNIALMNKGDMGTKMFKYNNMGNNPKNGFDTLAVHMVQTGAPIIYMNHAKTNFAIRWCIENGVEYGPKFNNLKILALCSLINGEGDAASKYLNILKNTIYYKDWAEHFMPLAKNPKNIKEYHEFDYIKELHDHMGSVLDGDQGLCEMYLLNYFANTINNESKKLQELTLNYAMVQKDIQLFWPRFFQYANMHKGEPMPIHYQEAAFLYGNLEHAVDISNMPFNKEKVTDRYAGFQQLSQSLLASGMKSPEVGEAMKASYGDTFYWFYFFCRDVHSY